MNKYHAKRQGGFSSRLEYSVYQLLLTRERAGEISDIRKQHCVDLTAACISWKVDFSFIEKSTGLRVWCEAKGLEKSDYRIKLKLWRVYGPGTLEIWKGSAARPFVAEIVVPRGSIGE
jgi:hypothetical protein